MSTCSDWVPNRILTFLLNFFLNFSKNDHKTLLFFLLKLATNVTESLNRAGYLFGPECLQEKILLHNLVLIQTRRLTESWVLNQPFTVYSEANLIDLQLYRKRNPANVFFQQICEVIQRSFYLFSYSISCATNEVFHYEFLQLMFPNPKETEDLVTLTKEIVNGKLHFLCSDLHVTVSFILTT